MALLYKTVCVLVSGPIGSGKTTFSNMLQDELSDWNTVRCSYAGRVKSIAYLLGWDGKKDERGRKLLQTLGTDCGRAYDKDVWVRYLIDESLPTSLGYPFDAVIIDDWRFPNERDYVENNGLFDVFAVRMVRDICEPDSHASENSLPSGEQSQGKRYYDSIIYNTGTLEALKRSAVATSEYLISKYNKGDK
jgi:hypothetical protein